MFVLCHSTLMFDLTSMLITVYFGEDDWPWGVCHISTLLTAVSS